MQRLALVGDHPRLHQVFHPVGEQFGVDAQVLVVVELAQHGVRDAADAHLQRRAVGDDRRQVVGDGFLLRRGDGHLHFGQEVVHFDYIVNLAHVDEAVAQGARHVRVDLGDDELGALGGGLGHADLGAIRAVAIAVGRRHLDERHINGQPPALEQAGNLRQEDGCEVRPPGVHCLADAGADEERVDAQVRGELWLDVVGFADDQHLDQHQIAEFQGALFERFHQALGHRGVAGDEEAVAGAQHAHGLLRRHLLGFVLAQPIRHQ